MVEAPTGSERSGINDLGWPATSVKFRYYGEPGSWADNHAPDGIEVELGPGALVAGGTATLAIVMGILGVIGKRYKPEEYDQARAALADVFSINTSGFGKDDEVGAGDVLKAGLGILGGFI